MIINFIRLNNLFDQAEKLIEALNIFLEEEYKLANYERAVQNAAPEDKEKVFVVNKHLKF